MPYSLARLTRTSLAALVGLALLTACDSEQVEVMKSPCVALEGSACGPKRPVNSWWQHPPAPAAASADHV